MHFAVWEKKVEYDFQIKGWFIADGFHRRFFVVVEN